VSRPGQTTPLGKSAVVQTILRFHNIEYFYLTGIFADNRRRRDLAEPSLVLDPHMLPKESDHESTKICMPDLTCLIWVVPARADVVTNWDAIAV
jgi:hypothetical protein